MLDVSDIQHQYAYGDCAPFAAALARWYGFPLVEFYNGKHLIHVAVEIENNMFDEPHYLDAYGVGTKEEYRLRYVVSDLTAKAVTEVQLHDTSLFDEDDIIVATECISTLVANMVLPVRKR